MRSSVARLVGIVTLLALWLVVVRNAAALDPGFDLFQTDPATTQFSFKDEATIPAGFFDTGSAAFTGTVNFGGVPIGTFMGHDVGDADTIVQRQAPATLAPPYPAGATVPIQLVQLQLQSVQPIQVQVGPSTELWDVRATVSPSVASQGQITIMQTSVQGGTFSSQLLVAPLFVFTRLSDGRVRTLDVGQSLKVPPTQQTNPTAALQLQSDLTLSSQNVPWRAGCVPPALAVTGLNDGFCPGLSTSGAKVDNEEQSRLAAHGVVPAQPPLEHFKCYAIKSSQGFKGRKVALVDQFGSSTAQVLAPLSLCTPAQKKQEPVRNRDAHLECFAIRVTPAFQPRTVAVRNQFGPDVLRLSRPTSLCAPTVKTTKPSKTPTTKPRPATLKPAAQIDHFTCYGASSQAKASPRQVDLADQFGHERVSVLQPVSLCAPVQKNGSPVLHPVSHLVCYQIADLSPVKFRVRAESLSNQFGTAVVSVMRPASLCVPSVKATVPTP